MRKSRMLLSIISILTLMLFFAGIKVSAEEQIATYDGELGIKYSSEGTTFNVWSGSPSSIKLVIGDNEKIVDLVKMPTNLWTTYVEGDLLNKTYTYTISYEDGTVYEGVLDPYGKFLNDERNKNIIYEDSLIGFEEWYNQTLSLSFDEKKKVIYGLNVETFTKSNTWNGTQVYKGKLLGLIQEGTKYSGISTGFDYIKNLGVTYVEIPNLLDLNNPYSVNKKLVVQDDIYAGNLELKQVVNHLYNNRISLIMNVDLINLADGFLNNLNKIDTDYYLNSNSKLDLNKTMVKKYIKDLIQYWVKQYKLGGIKFENMSYFDYELINNIVDELIEEDSNLMFYGDGSYLALNENSAGENNLSKLNNVKMINGSLNYALFGNDLNIEEKGVLAGNYNKSIMESLKFSLLSSVDNGDIDYSEVGGVSYKNYWGNQKSYQLINNIGGRNNLAIYDKLYLSGILSYSTIKQKVILAYGTQMASGGIPYIYSGNEFLMSYVDASKNENGNSICDSNNSFCFYLDESEKVIDWSYAYRYDDIINALKSLINFRKSNNYIVQTNAGIIKNNVDIYTNESMPGVIGYMRTYVRAYTNDTEKIFVVFNYSDNNHTIQDVTGKGWHGLYNYNDSSRDGDNITLNSSSIYMELKLKQPKVSPWITLILVVALIASVYTFNIYLSKKLVSKGYDVKNIKKKYRPFVKKEIEQLNSQNIDDNEEKSENDEEKGSQ